MACEEKTGLRCFCLHSKTECSRNHRPLLEYKGRPMWKAAQNQLILSGLRHVKGLLEISNLRGAELIGF